jgi:threonylcarbamoyladenosine tRNA methylthiotransferase MtaB
MSAPEIITFGCRLNAYESAVMAELARGAGLNDAVIINTCAVTAEAERQARQAIRKARRNRPGARIIVTGCAAQIDPSAYASMPEVDRVIGNIEKMQASSFAPDCVAPVVVGDIMAARETTSHLLAGFEGRTRAFVEIQQGCDHRCTFCIIPFGRGNNRSAPLGAITNQVRALVEGGTKEVVLTGVDITGYGADLPGSPSLGQMVRRLLAAVPELPRLRLGSIDVAEIDGDLMAAIAGEERLMPHLHLSLQSGDDVILKRMKRRHGRADAVAFAERVRRLRPGIVLGADLIVGFPTEDERAFQRTLDLVEQCGLTFLHVFPFSRRPGTPAARMPQIDRAERKARAGRLRQRGQAALMDFLERQVANEVSVLVEAGGKGRSEHYAPVRLDGAPARGSIVTASIVAVEDSVLVGRPA